MVNIQYQVLIFFCKNFKIKYENTAYIGDDVNDLELLKKTGLSFCPNDAISEVKKICNYTCKSNGGKGVFREVANMILKSQK